MTADELVLLIVTESGGHLRGKTLLQKRAYFVSVLLRIDLGFRPHYYGPYSPDVEGGLARNKALGFIEERTLGFGFADSSGFEARRYDYVITEDGTQIVGSLQQSDSEGCKKIATVLGMLRDAGDNGDHVLLSIAAKTCYILNRQNAAMKAEGIRSAAQSLGWHIGSSSIELAISFLEKVGLVEKGSAGSA